MVILKTVGKHLLIDACGCRSALLEDADKLERLLTDMIHSLGMEVLHSHFRHFHPQGVTGTLATSASHIVIHTWPEEKYAALDLFTRGATADWETIEKMLRVLTAERAVVSDHTRGDTKSPTLVREINLQSQISVKETPSHFQPRVVRATARDLIELQELLSGRHRIVYEDVSPYQDVLLLEAVDLRLYLDQQIQFSSFDERIYHELLVHPTLTMADLRDQVLILGGGDGLALREVLKYSDVRCVHLVDIDPVVIHAARNVPELVFLNEGAMHDQRVSVYEEDAQHFLNRVDHRYNIIVVDFPDPADEVMSRLYTREFYQKLSRFLLPEGILVCQSQSPRDAPLVFWTIARTLESVGLQTVSYHVNIPSFGDWGFHLAGKVQPLRQSLKVPVSTRTLPDDLLSFFEFDEKILAKRKQAVINTTDQLTLHELFAQEVGPQ